MFVKLVMSLVGAAGAMIAVSISFRNETVDAKMVGGCVAAVVGWFIGLKAGRMICDDPPAK